MGGIFSIETDINYSFIKKKLNQTIFMEKKKQKSIKIINTHDQLLQIQGLFGMRSLIMQNKALW